MTVFHQINNESLIYSKQLALNWLVFSSTKCSRPFLTVRPLQQTWHARPADDLIKFATLPVHDLERLKRHSCRNRKVLRRLGAHQKKFNKGRPTVSAAKCGPMILDSRNMRYMRIIGYSRGFQRGVASSTISILRNISPTAEDILVTCALTYLQPICVSWSRLLTLFVAVWSSTRTQERLWLWVKYWVWMKKTKF